MVLKGSQLEYTLIEIRSYGLETSQLGTQYKIKVKMLLKGVNWVNWVHNDKIQVIWS